MPHHRCRPLLVLGLALLVLPRGLGAEETDLFRHFLRQAVDQTEDPGMRIARLGQSPRPEDRRQAALLLIRQDIDAALDAVRTRLRATTAVQTAMTAALAADALLTTTLMTRPAWMEAQRALEAKAGALTGIELSPLPDRRRGEAMQQAWARIRECQDAMTALRQRQRQLIDQDEYLEKLRDDRNRAAEACLATWERTLAADTAYGALLVRRQQVDRWLQMVDEDRQEAERHLREAPHDDDVPGAPPAAERP